MKAWLRLATVVAACLCAVACQRASDLGRLGSPAQRLVGHWATSDGNQEFFSPVDATGVGQFTSMRSGGQPSAQRYRVLDEDPQAQAVRIVMLDAQDAPGEPRTITIAADGESAAVTQGQSSVALALARMDGAATPAQSRYVLPPPPATTVPARRYRQAYARNDIPPANPGFGPPANAPDGVYRYVLIGYDGMTPLYAWKRIPDASGTHPVAVDVAYSRGMARRHNYVIWLHTVAFAILLVTTLLFRQAIDEKFLIGSWIAAIMIGVLGVFALNIPVIAGIAEIIIALVLMVRGMLPKSDMLA